MAPQVESLRKRPETTEKTLIFCRGRASGTAETGACNTGRFCDKLNSKTMRPQFCAVRPLSAKQEGGIAV